MQISQDGISLIKNFEGVRYRAYQNADGTWTIGFGHTNGICEGMTITAEQADNYLTTDLADFEQYVAACVTVPLTQHQFDALVSFTYDLGKEVFRGSDLLAFLNAGQYERAADAILEHDHDHEGIRMVRRRNAERMLFLTPDQKPGWMQKITAWLYP